MLRKFTSLLTVAVLSFSCIVNVSAATTDDITMESIQNDLIAYLEKNHPEIEFGSDEFINYISDVSLMNIDEELAKLPNYDDIKFYCGEYLYELDNQMTSGNSMKLLKPSEDFLEKTIEEIQREVQEKDRLDEIWYQEIQNRPDTYATSYDVDSATKYAKDHAEKYNKDYNKYSKDCTNFVSQCLEAGGISMDKPSTIPEGVKDTTKYWYSIKYTSSGIFGDKDAWKESSSWVRVEDLYTYCVDEANAELHTYASLSALKQGVEVGDIVQIRNESGDWYHSIIISDYDTSDGFLYCGHTSDRRDYPINKLDPDLWYRAIRF